MTTSQPIARFGPLALAGFASIGAGAIHAAAIGVHNEHLGVVRTFAVLAALQVGWGALAVVGQRRSLAVAGAVISGAAMGGWIMAKTSGISFITGLDQAEAIGWADAAAAALATVAFLVVARQLLAGVDAPAPTAFARHSVAAVVAVVSLVAMMQAGTHSHADGADGHDHESAGPVQAGHDHAAPVPPVVYDPEATATTAAPTGTAVTDSPQVKRVDLSGVPGVTAEEQARAEELVVATLDKLPQFADQDDAKALGFYSIGDSITGHEHLINWDYIDDDHVLDPDYPESLVYETSPGGGRKLVSAMFMLPTGTELDAVPELGGPLTQWHIHDDLCFSDDPVSPHVAGITNVGGECRPPLTKLEPVPMIHVWIVGHPCGPFAALEGTGAGQIAAGEERLCDAAHGG